MNKFLKVFFVVILFFSLLLFTKDVKAQTCGTCGVLPCAVILCQSGSSCTSCGILGAGRQCCLDPTPTPTSDCSTSSYNSCITQCFSPNTCVCSGGTYSCVTPTPTSDCPTSSYNSCITLCFSPNTCVCSGGTYSCVAPTPTLPASTPTSQPPLQSSCDCSGRICSDQGGASCSSASDCAFPYNECNNGRCSACTTPGMQCGTGSSCYCIPNVGWGCGAPAACPVRKACKSYWKDGRLACDQNVLCSASNPCDVPEEGGKTDCDPCYEDCPPTRPAGPTATPTPTPTTPAVCAQCSTTNKFTKERFPYANPPGSCTGNKVFTVGCNCTAGPTLPPLSPKTAAGYVGDWWTQCSKPLGDADKNGITNNYDYDFWWWDFTQGTVTFDRRTNFNGDNIVDLKDFEIWRRNNVSFLTPTLAPP